MNLYKLYSSPDKLTGYEHAEDTVPDLIFELMQNKEQLNRKQISCIATHSKYAFLYAAYTLQGRFPEGEKAIAADANYAYKYALRVLHDRFPEGEAAIASDPYASFYYSKNVIKGRFPQGEAAIASDIEFTSLYNYWPRKKK
jgi:hypothetical protein